MDLNTLVREEMNLLIRTTQQKVELVMDLQEPLPPVLGEKGALGNALMNLCINALDAMDQGGTLYLADPLSSRGQGWPGGRGYGHGDAFRRC